MKNNFTAFISTDSFISFYFIFSHQLRLCVMNVMAGWHLSCAWGWLELSVCQIDSWEAVCFQAALGPDASAAPHRSRPGFVLIIPNMTGLLLFGVDLEWLLSVALWGTQSKWWLPFFICSALELHETLNQYCCFHVSQIIQIYVCCILIIKSESWLTFYNGSSDSSSGL